MNISTRSIHAVVRQLLIAGTSMLALFFLAPDPARANSAGEVIRSGKDVRMVFTGPATPTRDVATEGYLMTLTNADPVDVEDVVRVQFVIFADSTLTPDDVTVEVEAVAGSGSYQTLAMTTCWSDLCSDLGPAEGFPMPADYNASTGLRLTFHRAGQYTLQMNAIGVHTMNFYASGALEQTVVAPEVAMAFAGPASIDRGIEAAGFSATLINTGSAAVPESMALQFEISSQQSLVEGTAKISLETEPDSGLFMAVPLSSCGENLCGTAGLGQALVLSPGMSAVFGLPSTFDTVGSYQVQLRVIGIDSGIEYASGSFAVDVVSVPTTLLVVAGDDQTAPVGEAVAVAPTVRVLDAGGGPVEGASVVFRVGMGGGSVGESSVLSDTDGFAAPSCWTLGMAPGTNTLSVQVPGSFASGVSFDAIAMEPAQIAIAIATQVEFVTYGETQEHVIVVSNEGSAAAASVAFSIPVPTGYVAESAHWTCLAINAAQCPASGDGAIDAMLDLPIGSSAVFVYSAMVSEDAGDSIDFVAQAVYASDVTPQDNIAVSSTPVVLARSGFEAGDAGAGHVAQIAVPLATLDINNSLVLDLDAMPVGPVLTVAKGATAEGARFNLAVVFAGQSRIALLGVSKRGRPARWSQTVIAPSAVQVGIGLVDASEPASPGRLLVVGQGFELEQAFDASQRIQVTGVAH